MIGIMLSDERKTYILECLAREGRVLSQALCDALKVSEDTIRRDLRELAAEGRLKRVHGGALPFTRPMGLSSAERVSVRVDEKQALIAAMLGRLRQGQVILLDGGSTHVLLAQRLPTNLSLTVITHCPAIADALTQHAGVAVIVVGGRLLHRAGVVVGASVVDAFRGIRADLCILGACGVDAQFGVSCEEFEEVAVKRAMLASSTDAYVLATSDKFGETLPYSVVPVVEVGHILTTSAAPVDVVEACRAAGGQLECVAV